MQSIELAWAAGFYDGEGSTGVGWQRPGPRGGRRLRVLTMELPQVDERPLRRFAAAVGCGSISLRAARAQRPTHQPIWRWRANRGAAERALCALWPYLSAPKREQALDAVDVVHNDRCVRNASAA
jgi:hypothetical protein